MWDFIDSTSTETDRHLTAKCPHCGNGILPIRAESATPEGTGEGISASTWICPECNVILGVSEVNLLRYDS